MVGYPLPSRLEASSNLGQSPPVTFFGYNVLDLVDISAVELGDLVNRHPVLHQRADARKMRF